MQHCPLAVDLAEADGESQPALRNCCEFLGCSTAKQPVCEGDLLAGDDLQRQEVERRPLLPLEECWPGLPVRGQSPYPVLWRWDVVHHDVRRMLGEHRVHVTFVRCGSPTLDESADARLVPVQSARLR